MKKLALFLALAMLIAALAGCSAGTSTTTDTPAATTPETTTDTAATEPAADAAADTAAKSTGKLKIALCAANSNTFGTNLKAAAVEMADSLGIKMDYFLAEGNVDTQLNQIENAITNGYDAIILQPQNADGIVPGVEAIHEAGIPLVLVNMRANSEAYDVYVGSDNVDAGKMQGDWLAEHADAFLAEHGYDKLNIGYITVTMGTSTQIDRFSGFKNSAMADYENQEVLVYGESKAKRDLGMSITEDWMLAYPEMNCIVCQNDSAALGAMQAIADAGRTGEILLLGIDAEQEAAQAILDGAFSMTVYQDAKGQGSRAVEVAVGLAQGETYDKSVLIPFVSVDANNAADYVNQY